MPHRGSWISRLRCAACVLGVLLLCGTIALAVPVAAQQPEGVPEANAIDMTLERMTQLALSNSYEVRFLDMNIEQSTQSLRAERARLRSSVSLDVSSPVWEDISQEHFSTDLGRNEFFSENELRFEGQVSIRQPVILFGYPTNGYLSLNNRVYRLAQRETDGDRDVEYYNRYFIQYTQPLFQPNELKNSLEEAELDLESEEIDYYDDLLELIDDISDDYFDLFETAYEEGVRAGYVADLQEAAAAALAVSQSDSTRTIELDQIRVELANAEELLRQSRTEFRRRTADLRTQLDLQPTDSITIDPTIDVQPVEVDIERAVQFARTLAPRLRRIRIQERKRQINLDEVQGRNAFEVDVRVHVWARDAPSVLLEPPSRSGEHLHGCGERLRSDLGLGREKRPDRGG